MWPFVSGCLHSASCFQGLSRVRVLQNQFCVHWSVQQNFPPSWLPEQRHLRVQRASASLRGCDSLECVHVSPSLGHATRRNSLVYFLSYSVFFFQIIFGITFLS